MTAKLALVIIVTLSITAAAVAAVGMRPAATPAMFTITRWNWDGSKPMRQTFAVADVVTVERFSVKGVVGTRIETVHHTVYYTPDLPGNVRLTLQSMGWGDQPPKPSRTPYAPTRPVAPHR